MRVSDVDARAANQFRLLQRRLWTWFSY